MADIIEAAQDEQPAERKNIHERLVSQRERLATRLARIDAALVQLHEHPEFLEFYEAIRDTGF